MYTIYSSEKEEEYGVLGIKIKIDTKKLRNDLEKYIPYNEQEEVERKIMLNYFNTFDDVLTRQNEIGHFTSSAFVLNKERTKILMIYHEDENSGVKWVPIDEILNESSEVWVKDVVYAKIIEKMKKDCIVKQDS